MNFPSFNLSGEQIRAARAFLRLEQTELAKAAGVSLETVKRLERMRGPVDATMKTVSAIERAFHERGIVFDLAAGQGPGLRLMSSAQGQAGPDLAA